MASVDVRDLGAGSIAFVTGATSGEVSLAEWDGAGNWVMSRNALGEVSRWIRAEDVIDYDVAVML